MIESKTQQRLHLHMRDSKADIIVYGDYDYDILLSWFANVNIESVATFEADRTYYIKKDFLKMITVSSVPVPVYESSTIVRNPSPIMMPAFGIEQPKWVRLLAYFAPVIIGFLMLVAVIILKFCTGIPPA